MIKDFFPVQQEFMSEADFAELKIRERFLDKIDHKQK